MTAHIERTIDPANADKERIHLNRELVGFPEGVASRTQAIQHRIDTAGLIRKVGTNQVRALRIMLSGTPEDIQRIQSEGKLDEWCNDNIKRIVGLCKQIGLTFDSIRSLLFGKTLTGNSVKLYSSEYKQHFQAKEVQLKIEKEPDNPGKLRLSLNGQNIIDWFKQKYQELKQVTSYYKRPSIKPGESKNKGIKM
jgi:hypothetical protein